MKERLVSVIIPGYNEEKIVADTISRVESTMREIGRPYELLIVDDGSTDKTAAILQQLSRSKKHPHMRFVSYRDGPSRRENLAKSFRLLKGDYVLLLDMDLSLDIIHLKDMLHWLDEGYGMVIINRYHRDSRIRRNLKRYIISKLYNAFIRLLFRTGFRDNICGFKAFRKDVISRLVAEAGFDSTGKRSVFWDTQVLILAKRAGIKIREIPAHWEESPKSSLRFGRESGMLPYVIRFWLSSGKK